MKTVRRKKSFFLLIITINVTILDEENYRFPAMCCIGMELPSRFSRQKTSGRLHIIGARLFLLCIFSAFRKRNSCCNQRKECHKWEETRDPMVFHKILNTDEKIPTYTTYTTVPCLGHF